MFAQFGGQGKKCDIILLIVFPRSYHCELTKFIQYSIDDFYTHRFEQTSDDFGIFLAR